MRSIGHLPDGDQARLFADFLASRGIRNQIEPDAGTGWIVWIADEDQIAPAQVWLESFRADPASAEFRGAPAIAAKAREAEARERADYQRRVRTRKSLFPSFGGYGIGFLTYSLILLCIVSSVANRLGGDHEALRWMLLADPANADGTFLPEVRRGEFWRLIAPCFVHFGPMHLLFNLMWLHQLGCMIEARQGVLRLALLVVIGGVLPMVAQYATNGPGYVGGMSGLVYALAGYVWMRGKYHPASGLFLDRQSVQWMLAWLVICFTGLLGPIANTAHVAGLVIGVVWGRVSAFLASRRPE
ncbi:MAG: rhomboid family intramembrane serine protease [Verrucomicrobia bacterium]|nr:MAG: rhomboid family intramembrane serine protease [Verrucomicrobiota bacterium]